MLISSKCMKKWISEASISEASPGMMRYWWKPRGSTLPKSQPQKDILVVVGFFLECHSFFKKQGISSSNLHYTSRLYKLFLFTRPTTPAPWCKRFYKSPAEKLTTSSLCYVMLWFLHAHIEDQPMGEKHVETVERFAFNIRIPLFQSVVQYPFKISSSISRRWASDLLWWLS